MLSASRTRVSPTPLTRPPSSHWWRRPGRPDPRRPPGAKSPRVQRVALEGRALTLNSLLIMSQGLEYPEDNNSDVDVVEREAEPAALVPRVWGVRGKHETSLLIEVAPGRARGARELARSLDARVGAPRARGAGEESERGSRRRVTSPRALRTNRIDVRCSFTHPSLARWRRSTTSGGKRLKSATPPRAKVGIFGSKTSSRTPGNIGELCATRRGKECRIRRCQRTSRTRARRRRSPSRSKRSTCKTRAWSVDVRRVDDDVEELRELVDAKFAALASMLRENLSVVASRAQLASGGETAP